MSLHRGTPCGKGVPIWLDGEGVKSVHVVGVDGLGFGYVAETSISKQPVGLQSKGFLVVLKV